jgi:hypothetical protein
MPIKSLLNILVRITGTSLLSIAIAHAKLPIEMTPTTSTKIQNPNSGITIIEYQVTNQMKTRHTFAMKPMSAAMQDTSVGKCGSPFVLQPGGFCMLSLKIDRNRLSELDGGPQICVTKSPSDNSPGSYICTQSTETAPTVTTIDPNFPYGSAPTGNVCVSTDNYATPETMLGSWAMLQAASMDTQGSVLPGFLSDTNTVYAVGTAALGDQLGIANCSGGCNELNGYCFALKFNGKTPYPYMIFQSVNIGANPDSFDIYMAGGGSGAFPAQCQTFWGTGGNINWADHIQNSSCSGYFGDYSSINSTYSVTYNGIAHTAKTTLQNACAFASTGQSGFNTQNWSNVSVVPVTCPTSLIQITGVELPTSITTVGNQAIHNLSTLTDSDFAASTLTPVTTTQMQDCKTPSSGYCSNVAVSVPNYEASISASLTEPLLTGTPPSSTYCQSNPGTTYCSWNNGQTMAGGTYCNENMAQNCISCGGGAQRCVCNGNVLLSCTS